MNALVLCVAGFAAGAAAQTTVTTSSPTTAGYIPVLQSGTTITNSVITQSSGNLGVNNSAPVANLDVNQMIAVGATLGADRMTLGVGSLAFNRNASTGAIFNTSAYAYQFQHLDSSTQASDYLTLAVFTPAGTQVTSDALTINGYGNVGIGTSSPGAPLEVWGNIKITAGTGGSIIFQDGSTQSTAYTGVTCGGDYAESVDVIGDRTHYEPGDILVIDPTEPGKFLKSNQAYSTMVAGIYSTKPGTVGRRQTTPKSPDEVPMAMMGIVPAKVSAENGPIKTGDLLVASSTLGYAMKGTDRTRLTGAVVGKALGSLNSGAGVIEVLVALQ
jgi:hypothetical protein